MAMTAEEALHEIAKVWLDVTKPPVPTLMAIKDILLEAGYMRRKREER